MMALVLECDECHARLEITEVDSGVDQNVLIQDLTMAPRNVPSGCAMQVCVGDVEVVGWRWRGGDTSWRADIISEAEGTEEPRLLCQGCAWHDWN